MDEVPPGMLGGMEGFVSGPNERFFGEIDPKNDTFPLNRTSAAILLPGLDRAKTVHEKGGPEVLPPQAQGRDDPDPPGGSMGFEGRPRSRRRRTGSWHVICSERWRDGLFKTQFQRPAKALEEEVVP